MHYLFLIGYKNEKKKERTVVVLKNPVKSESIKPSLLLYVP